MTRSTDDSVTTSAEGAPAPGPDRARTPGGTPARAGVAWGAPAALLLVGILLLALSLRSGIGSLSVLLPTVRDALDFSPAGVSVLTTLPPLCFALVGLGTGRLVLRFGVHRVTVALLVAIAAGLLVRSVTGSVPVFLLATVLAMAGAAIGNVVLPPLTKRHFPQRAALVSALYGAAMVGGATLASTLTVPVADATGSWRVGLACWAVVPLLGVLAWLPTLRRSQRAIAAATGETVAPDPEQATDPTTDPTTGQTTGQGEHAGQPERRAGRPLTLGALARTRLGWAFAICFGAQASQAYVQLGWWGSMLTESGADDAHAGLLLGIVTGTGVPVTLALPALIRLTRGGPVLPIAFAAATVVGWAGLLLAPLALGGTLWALLLGFGGGAFTWVLAMLAHRSRTTEGTAQLSALAQGVGYLVASAATFAAGLLHDTTGSWDAAIVMVLLLAVVIGVAGTVLARGGTIEDAVAERR